MADGHAALDPDRLPWLADTRIRRRSSDSASLLAWAVAATLLVAGVSYWMGMKSIAEPEPFDVAGQSSPAATVQLPEPAVVPPRVQEVLPAPAPEVKPVAEPVVPIPRPEPVRAERAAAAKAKAATAAPVKKKAVKKKAAAPRPARLPARLKAWPASQSAGARGRLVRIGTFGSRRQAKQGWARIIRVYPGMGRLRAVVVPSRSLRNGRTFYRLQFGTTSQAHSEVLCQRMRIVALSCVTVGLPARDGRVRR